MQISSIELDKFDLYRDLLATVIQSRAQMDAASARADILLNLFLFGLEHRRSEKNLIDHAVSNLELEMLDARDAPQHLRDATADTARAIWAYHANPTSVLDQVVRDAFIRWESVYTQSIGESPSDTYMDIENARCLTESDYYSTPPLPFPSRARLDVFGNQN